MLTGTDVAGQTGGFGRNFGCGSSLARLGNPFLLHRVNSSDRKYLEVMRLSDFFQLTEKTAATHTWALLTHDPETVSPQDALAAALADRIMEDRCRGCPDYYSAWRLRGSGGPTPSGAAREALLRGFIGPVFGLPDDANAIAPAHLEGFVCQQLWYFLYLESPPEELVRIEPPGFKSTDPGGDSLAIHRVASGYLMFRLWEIKKFAGDPRSTTSVSSTVSEAYGQLNSNALEYLARYTEVGQQMPNAELQAFYGQLCDLWVNAGRETSAGVAVATSLCHVPVECFTTFGQRFPKLVDPVRLRGMLTAIGDFSDFSIRVRDYVWKGI
jgi:hypothetical protein